jgi:hypothetical protein
MTNQRYANGSAPCRSLAALVLTTLVATLAACGNSDQPEAQGPVTKPAGMPTPTPEIVASRPASQPSGPHVTPWPKIARIVLPATPKFEPVEGKQTVLPNGLGYVDLVEGTSPTPRAGQEVLVDYTGWLENGSSFDSSRTRPDAFSFQLGLGKFIPGWDLGIATMKVGGKRRLIIPAALAYGEEGQPPKIPGNATLIFDVELYAIR